MNFAPVTSWSHPLLQDLRHGSPVPCTRYLSRTSKRYSVPCPTSLQKKSRKLQNSKSSIHYYSSRLIISPLAFLCSEQLNAPSLWQSAWMICPRWTPRATATLANLGGSSRQCSSRHVLRPSKDAASRPRCEFSTIGGGNGEGNSDSLPRDTSQSLNNTQRTSPRPTAASTSGSTSNPLPRRRTWTPATSATDAAGLDQRLRNQPNTGEARRPRVGGRNQGGGSVEDESQDTPHLEWPQLQRRAREGKQYGHAWNSVVTIPKNPFSRRQSIQNPRGAKESSFVMLIIDGMSPNLNAADFYRITPNDLSDWKSVIKKGYYYYYSPPLFLFS